MKTIRLMIADDHGLLRMGLATLMKFHPDIEVVGDAENGREAVELVRKLRPDVVVMDLMMPVMGGVEATRLIHEAQPEVRILILTTFGTSTDVALAVRAGAAGALVKDTPNDELIEAIRAVAGGASVFSPEIRRVLDEDPDPVAFTPRQMEVLKALTRGLSNPDIAKLLSISSDAVKQHVNAIFTKLGAANRAEAVAIALRKHLLKI